MQAVLFVLQWSEQGEGVLTGRVLRDPAHHRAWNQTLLLTMQSWSSKEERSISLPITSSLPFTQWIYRPLFLSLVLSSLIHSCPKLLLFPRSLTLPSFRFCLHYCFTPPSHNGRWRKNIGEIYTALGNGKMNDLPKWKEWTNQSLRRKSLTDQWSGLPTHTQIYFDPLWKFSKLTWPLWPISWPCRHWVKSWADRALSFYSCPMCIQPRKGKRRGDSSPPLLHTHHTKQSYMQTHRTHMHTI